MDFLGHRTVMKDELVSSVFESNVNSLGRVYFDLTLGGGGHSLKLLEVDNASLVVCVDQDEDALANARKIFSENDLIDRVKFIKSNFSEIKKILDLCREFIGDREIAGIIADIGVSSHQFDERKRGFSFRFEGPLDMRMDQTDNSLTASDVINNYEPERLVDIFEKYGEEKLAKRIVENIEEFRRDKKIETTKELENIVFHSYPKKWRYGRTHPATKVFQALRVYVNKELDVLERMIPAAFECLSPGGRLSIITFHSLEDRIVKNMFKEFYKTGAGKLLQKKPFLPSDDEIKVNPRSRSAKLRVVEKN